MTDEITAREIAAARVSYPNATSDLQALAFAASTLRKNLAERTQERDARNRQICELTGRGYVDG